MFNVKVIRLKYVEIFCTLFVNLFLSIINIYIYIYIYIHTHIHMIKIGRKVDKLSVDLSTFPPAFITFVRFTKIYHFSIYIYIYMYSSIQ